MANSAKKERQVTVRYVSEAVKLYCRATNA